jgi:hypothetical protein
VKRWFRTIPLTLVALVSLSAPASRAQTARSEMKSPSRALVRIYRVATGKHLEFLKWLAENEAFAKEAGLPATQVYAHTDGDSWDYLDVGPVLSDEQQAKLDEVTKKHGRKTGFGSSLEFRAMIASHSDTFVIGPMSAAELVALAK